MKSRDQHLAALLHTAHKVFMLGAEVMVEEFDEFAAFRMLDRLDELNNLAHECAGPTATSSVIMDTFMEMAPAILGSETDLDDDIAPRYGSAMCMAYVEFMGDGN